MCSITVLTFSCTYYFFRAYNSCNPLGALVTTFEIKYRKPTCLLTDFPTYQCTPNVPCSLQEPIDKNLCFTTPTMGSNRSGSLHFGHRVLARLLCLNILG